jgi:hypothetical protein
MVSMIDWEGLPGIPNQELPLFISAAVQSA